LSITPLAADVGGTDITEITLQRSIIAAGLRPKSLGSLIVGPDDHSTELKQVSLHHNLWAHNAHRNPLIRNVTEGQLVNNVVYNWRNRVTRFGDSTRVDVIKNYYRAGPWSGNNSNQVLQHDTDNALSPLFLEGNVAIPFQPDPNANQQNLIRFAGTGAPLPPGLFATTRYSSPRIPITETSALQAWTDVLADVGANKRISCRGDWIPAQDALDQRIISDALNHVGPSTDTEADDPGDFGGLPSFPPGSPCVDRDQDGMPDEFEIRYGLDPDDSSDNQQDPDRDGWVNMEEYINGTDPNR